ncbi:hypothetical protein LHGZ1_1419 [Laribacter hongkongensis]|uniref:Uncharacterized protein n=1 Tax=Laribacter hongkongensis TaxID=168471 RepID=A0A248LHJ8_9NEIS|nr:hypothetical protein LHGZ1_1419 [Laribacter hongkongensis]
MECVRQILPGNETQAGTWADQQGAKVRMVAPDSPFRTPGNSSPAGYPCQTIRLSNLTLNLMKRDFF